MSLYEHLAEPAAVLTAEALDDRAPADNYSRPLSPARAALRAAVRSLDLANAELARCNAPIGRLEDVIGAAAACDTELEGRHRQYHSRLGSWYATGAQGPRPEPDIALLDCERRLAARQADALAAREVLADHRRAAQRAAEGVRSAMERRAVALRQAVIDATRQYLPELERAYTVAQEVETKVADVEAALMQNGDAAAASTVRELVLATRQAIAKALPPVDAARGQAFLNRLLSDHEATL